MEVEEGALWLISQGKNAGGLGAREGKKTDSPQEPAEEK
jgi:hypothetical protein